MCTGGKMYVDVMYYNRYVYVKWITIDTIDMCMSYVRNVCDVLRYIGMCYMNYDRYDRYVYVICS